MDSTDSQLVQAALAGDRLAAERLVERHYQPIYAFLRRLSGNETEAADLTQRAFARIWPALPGFAGRSTVSSWMHSIAWRTYVDWLRTDHRTETRPDAWWEECEAPSATPAQEVAATDLAAVVYASVNRLEPELRITIHLHHYQDLSLEETANALNVATATVKYRLRQARTELQKMLAADRGHFINQPSPPQL